MGARDPGRPAGDGSAPPTDAPARRTRVPIGPLTPQDRRLLQEHCGYVFAWPPTEGQAVPRAALFVGYARLQQLQEGGLRDLFDDLQQVRHAYQRLTGENPVDDAFLAKVARTSDSALARAFLAAGGTTPRYA